MQSEAVVGERVTVELPDGSTVNGKVTQVSPVAQSQQQLGRRGRRRGRRRERSGGSGSPSADDPGDGRAHRPPPAIAGLDQAAVSVNFARRQAKHVLSVPVTALLATAGGGYAVQASAAPHRLIPVTPGLFAAGYVQISGAGHLRRPAGHRLSGMSVRSMRRRAVRPGPGRPAATVGLKRTRGLPGGVARAAWRQRRDRRRRAGRRGRTVGLGQDDDADRARHPGETDLGLRRGRRHATSARRPTASWRACARTRSASCSRVFTSRTR